MQFITLDTVDDPRVEAYVSLTEMQLRNRLEPAKGVFIAESPKVIDRALAADREPLSLLVEEPWLEGMKDTFDFIDGRWGADIPVYVASPEQLKRLTGYRLHRGALCAMRRWPLPSVAEICRSARRVAVMENIVDHTNVGALMRSAAALDVDAVLVTPSCGDPLYRRAARVSMGTVFQIPWTRITGFNDDGTENKHYWPLGHRRVEVAGLHHRGHGIGGSFDFVGRTDTPSARACRRSDAYRQARADLRYRGRRPVSPYDCPRRFDREDSDEPRRG